LQPGIPQKDDMGSYLYVAAGSAAGGLARFILGGWLQRRLDGLVPRAGASPFPAGTLIVNVTGSFLVGLILAALSRRGGDGDALRLLLAVGFCGGYTTFSTFSADTVALLDDGAGAPAALNVAASVALSLLATVAGVALARTLFPARV
jgi:CrcB protein